MTIPNCEFCHRPISMDSDYRVVSGWERIQRTGGGTNAIRLPNRKIEKFACRWCIDKQASGLAVEQQTFDVN